MSNPPPQTPPPKGGGASTSPRRTPVKFARRTTTNTDIERARSLRRDMPKTERILWTKLRELPPELGLTFRRQHPVHPYILDFACIKIKLAIEIDGDSHADRQAQDKNRDLYLSRQGYLTLRFTEDDVFNNADGVTETIVREALKRVQVEALPPWGEGWVGGQQQSK